MKETPTRARIVVGPLLGFGLKVNKAPISDTKPIEPTIKTSFD